MQLALGTRPHPESPAVNADDDPVGHQTKVFLAPALLNTFDTYSRWGQCLCDIERRVMQTGVENVRLRTKLEDNLLLWIARTKSGGELTIATNNRSKVAHCIFLANYLTFFAPEVHALLVLSGPSLKTLGEVLTDAQCKDSVFLRLFFHRLLHCVDRRRNPVKELNKATWEAYSVKDEDVKWRVRGVIQLHILTWTADLSEEDLDEVAQGREIWVDAGDSSRLNHIRSLPLSISRSATRVIEYRFGGQVVEVDSLDNLRRVGVAAWTEALDEWAQQQQRIQQFNDQVKPTLRADVQTAAQFRERYDINHQTPCRLCNKVKLNEGWSVVRGQPGSIGWWCHNSCLAMLWPGEAVSAASTASSSPKRRRTHTSTLPRKSRAAQAEDAEAGDDVKDAEAEDDVEDGGGENDDDEDYVENSESDSDAKAAGGEAPKKDDVDYIVW